MGNGCVIKKTLVIKCKQLTLFFGQPVRVSSKIMYYYLYTVMNVVYDLSKMKRNYLKTDRKADKM